MLLDVVNGRLEYLRERERERERESNKIIEMTKNIGHYFYNFSIF